MTDLERVSICGTEIQHIKNPSEAVQLEAVKQNGYAIENIKNPSEAVQLEAVKQDGYAIKYIKNPSEAVQLEAVKQNGYAIKYIKNPSEAVMIAAFENGAGVTELDNSLTNNLIIHYKNSDDKEAFKKELFNTYTGVTVDKILRVFSIEEQMEYFSSIGYTEESEMIKEMI